MAKDERDTEVAETSSATPAPRGVADRWGPLLTLRQEIDRMFEDFDLGNLNRGSWRHGLRPVFGALAPASELVETEDDYRLTMELPGLTEKDVELKVSDGALTLRGEKSEERKDQKKDYHMSERRYGSFHRTFPLPRGVDAGRIGATVADGVLTVTLPKSKEAKKMERKIEIRRA